MTDTATTTQVTPTSREAIRQSWIAYVEKSTYDLTRSAFEFIPEGMLIPISDFSKTQSEKESDRLSSFKNILGIITNFIHPKISFLSNIAGVTVGFLAGQTMGRLIGQFSANEKQTPYELDKTTKMGWIHRASTNFASQSVKYILMGTLASMVRNGTSLGKLLFGATVGLAVSQLPKIMQFIGSKLPASTPQTVVPEKPLLNTEESSLTTNNNTEFDILANNKNTQVKEITEKEEKKEKEKIEEEKNITSVITPNPDLTEGMPLRLKALFQDDSSTEEFIPTEPTPVKFTPSFSAIPTNPTKTKEIPTPSWHELNNVEMLSSGSSDYSSSSSSSSSSSEDNSLSEEDVSSEEQHPTRKKAPRIR